MRLPSLIIVSLLLAALALPGCGYNFRGQTSSLPPDVRTIAIPVFENRTGELRIEGTFTNELLERFTRSQILRVVSEGQADAVLKGIIVSADVEDVTYTTSDTSSRRRITIALDARLLRRSNGEALWEGRNIRRRRTFSVGNTPQGTEDAKGDAITRLAEDMSQTLHDLVLENF